MLIVDFSNSYNHALVWLSFTLAVLASFVSLELAGRIRASTGRIRLAWLLAAGVAMGGGIWSMHFVAMSAIELPFALAYDGLLTVLSLLIAILVTTIGLYTVFWHRGATKTFILGGALMGIGVAAMHYIGMAALIMPAVMHYDIRLVVASIMIAIVASTAALWLAFRVAHFALKLASALLMGFSVFAMHFTGMAAFLCTPAHDAHLAVPGLSSTALAAGVASTSGVILLLGLVLAIYDQRSKRRVWAAFVMSESKRRIDVMLQNATDLIAIIDRDWIVTYMSPTFGSLVSGEWRPSVGTNLLSLIAPETQHHAGVLLDKALKHPGRPVREVFQGTNDLGPEWFEITLNNQSTDPAIQGIIVNLRDITEQKRTTALIESALMRAHATAQAAEEQAQALEKAHEETRVAEEQARLLARHDALTGLPNRRLFSADLQSAVSRAQNGGMPCSVLLIDLDGFKKINDLQGHQVGDRVLCEVAQRLMVTIDRNDMTARLGGDEFAIIAEGEIDPQEHLERAKRLADQVIAAIRQPILSCDSRIEIGASIGVAFCRAEVPDVGSLLHAADIAMYRAKQSGKNTFRFFDQRMDEETREKEEIEKELIRAVKEEKIKPYYQPLVDIAQNRIRGFEALARWEHPDRGFVPPDVFIPIVEQLGLMNDMTMSVLRQACRDARLWPEEIHISVNFSPSELKDPQLPNRILAILAQEDLAPTRLEIEITESALVSDIDRAKAIVTTLQGAGISICLDDFGTGYSSLYHLRELKFDKIKIDRSFVQSMQKNNESEVIIDAILGLTSNLNLPTVAEGIENAAVQALLVAKGCEYGQGYYFGKAMTGESALALMMKDACSPTADAL